MTAQPPDPDPTQTPDLERGGGVAPGATPPAAPQTSGVAEAQPPNRRRFTPGATLTVLAVCVFSVAFLAVAVLLVMKMVGAH
ncbi:hypothetical protein A5712_23480 [Mycobacterium sp. E2327]|uniref:DUF6480 family protein n=1 Tax=Mycobacterium sp. E2327 TaxID=1834132 RepID=UPI000800B5A4|nr:DUF6480 family protein [Mycobacterium sp. E2327]OBI17743.1 hypothetical protein A5712_23480 [Mycobacterium sp. E2327]